LLCCAVGCTRERTRSLNSLPDAHNGSLHTPSVSDHPHLMVVNTPPPDRSTEDTHMDLGVASIVPQLVVGNATAMHSIAASILGALWAHVNKQMAQAQARQDASKHQRDSQNMDNVGQCRRLARKGLERDPEKTCQCQPAAGYDRSIGYELALGALGEGLYP
jgi:hypothetical protein